MNFSKKEGSNYMSMRQTDSRVAVVSRALSVLAPESALGEGFGGCTEKGVNKKVSTLR